jgi:hypothetical protein
MGNLAWWEFSLWQPLRPSTTTIIKSQHHGLAKVGITTTKTPLSSGFKTKSEKQNH